MPQSQRSHRKLTPAEALRHLSGLAELYGYRLHVSQPGLTTSTYSDGFPTYILIGHRRLLFLTLANPKGQLLPSESAWLDELNAVDSTRAHIIDRGDFRTITSLIKGNGNR